MKTVFAAPNIQRSFEEATPPEGWLAREGHPAFVLRAVEKIKGSGLDVNDVGYTTSQDVADAWVSEGELPPGRTKTYTPALTPRHLFPGITV